MRVVILEDQVREVRCLWILLELDLNIAVARSLSFLVDFVANDAVSLDDIETVVLATLRKQTAEASTWW